MGADRSDRSKRGTKVERRGLLFFLLDGKGVSRVPDIFCLRYVDYILRNAFDLSIR
jgi:hypothetical protein